MSCLYTWQITVTAVIQVVLNVSGEHRWLIHVLALNDKRGAAPIAQTLYREDADSHAQRQTQIAERKLLGQAHRVKAPDKKDRRNISKLKQTGWDSIF